MNDIDKKIEAILFFTSEPVSKNKLAKMLDVSTEEIEGGIRTLSERLEAGSGLALTEAGESISLRTKKDFSDIIEKISDEEVAGDLSRAAQEVLAIILYKNGATRSDIDFIRGVNSTYTLRALVLRGMIERVNDDTDNRRAKYLPTHDLFSFLGITKKEDLPDYAEIISSLEEISANVVNSENEGGN